MIALLFLLAQEPAANAEELYYRIQPVPAPEGVVLETSGIALLPDGRPIVCTRRGEIYVIDGAYGEPGTQPLFHLFAQGLQEPLGLLPKDGWIYCQQRAELSRLRDVDGDLRADELETVCDDWRLSGNYHEYAFGPVLDREGNFWITTNRPFGDQPFGDVPWRGFALRITPQGQMQPMCSGLRSPCGIATSPAGELFYTDNQGEWCATSKLCELVPGRFYGHPWGIASCKDPLWKFPAPADPPNEVQIPELIRRVPEYQPPAVWFPYDKMGRSACGFAWDTSAGRFGPFAQQIFVGDQYQSSVLRVCLERVEGGWQGACFPFRLGLGSGVVRVAFGKDGSLFCGETNRGWGSLGPKTSGLERLVWSGVVPFEMLAVHARPDGFEIEFTRAVDAASAAERANWELESYTYLHHEIYGSDEVDKQKLELEAAEVAPDRMSVRLRIRKLREGYVHEIHARLRSTTGEKLLHDAAYYTLTRIPSGG